MKPVRSQCRANLPSKTSIADWLWAACTFSPRPSRILATFALSFILAACSGGSGGGDSNPAPATVQPTTEFVQNQPAEPEPAPNEPTTSETFTVSLSWSPPTTRENGDVLLPSEIAKYEIYYINETQGSDPDCCMLTVDNPAQTTAQISIASSGTYFFSILAYDTDLVASQMSEPIALTF